MVDPAQREHARFMRAEHAMGAVDGSARNGLVLAYLDCEDAAVWVLEDFVAFADLPRVRPGGLDQRVRYVLALLPPLLAHGLACDFVDHILDYAERGPDDLFRHGVATKRSWLAGDTPDIVLKEVRKRVHEQSGFGAVAAAALMSSSPSAGVPQRVSKAAAKEMEGGFNWRELPAFGFQAETKWQAQQIRSALG